MRVRFIGRILTLVVSFAYFCHTLAQTSGLPDPSPEVRRQEQRQEQLRRELEIRPDVQLGEMPTASLALLPQEQPCRFISAVVFEGSDNLQAALQNALSGSDGADSPFGQCIGVQGIAVLVERTRNALIAQGYITSRVEVPTQDLSAGSLLLRVVIGRIATIVKGGDELSAWQLEPIRSDAALQLRDIEQSLENLRRISSAQADIQLRPGAQADTSDLVLEYAQRRPLRLNFALDDSGSTTTGKLLGSSTLSWDSPLGLSDLAYISTSHDAGDRDAGPRGNASQTLHYSVPWGYWLWSLTVNQSEYRQTIAGAFQSYLYSGQTQSQDMQLSRVVHRDTHSKTILQIKGFTKRSLNFIDDTEVLVQRRQTAGWEASMQHQQRVGEMSGDINLSFKQGTGALGALPAPEEAFGEGTSQMQIGTVVLNMQWPLPLPARLQATHHLRLQLNNTPLVPQDRLCLGGRYSVRGFDGIQTLCGDRGYVTRNELNWTVNEHISTYIALDGGEVGGRSAQELPDRFLSGYAIGLRGQSRVANDLAISFDAFASQPLSKPEFLSTASTTAGFNLSLSF
jgi:hemolysin activation/secretion protein